MNGSILIIDDDKEMCEEISEALRDEGFDIDCSHDGNTGSELLKKGNYDIVILDLRLPGKSGLEILKGVREDKIETKILICSGRPLKSEITKDSATLGAEEQTIYELSDGILTKPFDIFTLTGMVKELMK